jgi:hypothetical protein
MEYASPALQEIMQTINEELESKSIPSVFR